MTGGEQIVYSAVIPVFNESGNIRPLYERLTDVLDRLGSPYEIIFVDDGSKDSSYDELKEIAISDKRVKVLGFIRNFGQHRAVVAGIKEAYGDYIITMDSDLQNPPEEIPRLIEKLQEGYDIVSGCRAVRKDPLLRLIFSFFANRVISARTGLRMRDYGSMLRVFKKDAAKALADEFEKTTGYITMLIAKVTRNISEVEVAHNERFSGESKYTIRRLLNAFFRVLFRYDRKLRQEGPLFIIGRKIEDAKESLLCHR